MRQSCIPIQPEIFRWRLSHNFARISAFLSKPCDSMLLAHIANLWYNKFEMQRYWACHSPCTVHNMELMSFAYEV